MVSPDRVDIVPAVVIVDVELVWAVRLSCSKSYISSFSSSSSSSLAVVVCFLVRSATGIPGEPSLLVLFSPPSYNSPSS